MSEKETMKTPGSNDSRKTMLLYTEAYYVLKEMEPEEAGTIMLALLEYQLTGIEKPLDKHLRPVYISLRMQIDRTNQKYDEARMRKQEAGRKGGLDRVQNAKMRTHNPSANVSSAIDSVAETSTQEDSVAGSSNAKQNEANVHIPVPAHYPEPMHSPNPVALSRESAERDKAQEFIRLWNVYPRHQSMEDAKDAYMSLNLPPLNVMLAAVERLKASAQWQQDNGRYIPTLSRWLRSGGWEDHLPPPNVGYQRHGDPISPTMLAAVQEMLAESDD